MKKLSMKEVQTSELEILLKVKEICEKLNLRYYLAFGTLIGAVRHRGFIPWDDDLDIMMPREDYNKLIGYFEKNKEKLYPLKPVYVWHEKKYSYAMARITDMRYKLKYSNKFWYSNEDMGTFIDIYPMDGMGNNEEDALALSKKSIKLIKWISYSQKEKQYVRRSAIKNLLAKPIELYAGLRGEDYFHSKLIKLVAKYKYDESDYVGFVTWHGAVYTLRREMFSEGTEIDFCNLKFKVPSQYKDFLTSLYGDYMKLPPESERVATHCYDAYLRKEN